MVRRAAKIDGNHRAIVEALEAAGAVVQSLAAVGDGCPDILAGYRGVNHLIEVKDGSLPPSGRLLTPKQKAWHARWQGKACIANNVADALLIIGASSTGKGQPTERDEA